MQGMNRFIHVVSVVPWVPEVSRGPLRDLPVEGRLTSGEAAGYNRDIDRDRKPRNTNLWHPGYICCGSIFILLFLCVW